MENGRFGIDAESRQIERAVFPSPIVSRLKKQEGKGRLLFPEDGSAESRKRDFRKWIRESTLARNNVTGEVEVSQLNVDALITVTAEVFEWQPAHYWKSIGYCFDVVKALMKRSDRGLQVSAQEKHDLWRVCNFGDGEYKELPEAVESYVRAQYSPLRKALNSICATLFARNINKKRIEGGLREYNPESRGKDIVMYPMEQGMEGFEPERFRGEEHPFSRALELETRQAECSEANLKESTRKRKISKVALTGAETQQMPVKVKAKKAKKRMESKEAEERMEKAKAEGLKQKRQRWRQASVTVFASQYNNLSQKDLYNAEPLREQPKVHKGKYWSLTSVQRPTISAKEVARKMTTRLPKDLEDVELKTLFELAIFRKLLTLINSQGESRLMPDRGMTDLFCDDSVLRNRQLARYSSIVFERQGDSWLKHKSIVAVMKIWAEMISEADEEWNKKFEEPMMIERKGRISSTCPVEVVTLF